VNNFPVSLNIGRQEADRTIVALSISETYQPPRRLDDGGFSTGTVATTVARHAVLQPDTLALVDANSSLTYAELQHFVDHIAFELSVHGVKRGDRVGLALEPNAQTVAVILGLHVLGAAYVPFDVRQPAARLQSMVEDADVRFVVGNPESNSAFSDVGLRHLQVTELTNIFPSSGSEQNSGHIASFRPAGVDPMTDTAYVIFTSGSTGRPKGVEITHANLDALMVAWDRVMGSTKHTSLLLSTLTFDASVAELFWPLHRGGTLVVAAKADALPGGAGLGNLIRKHNIDHVQCTPTRATLLLSDPCDKAALAQVKHLVIGGEALTRPLARKLLDAGIERITNAYGPTEATVWAFTAEVTAESSAELPAELPTPMPTEIVCIGVPLHAMSSAVVDGEGNDIAEFGVVGELVLGGPFVARGYLNRPDLTAERFFSRSYPFSNTAGSHGSGPSSASLGAVAPNHQSISALSSYRTGDLVARNADGTLAFHGRTDDQVKIRGHRVELGEIEAALMTHPQVQQSVVVAHARHESNELVALVVSNSASTQPATVSKSGTGDDPQSAENGELRGSELRAYLTARLPMAMVPSKIVFVPGLPLTPSNKIDRVHVREAMVPQLFVDDVAEQTPLIQSQATESPGDDEFATDSELGHADQNNLESPDALGAMVHDFTAVLGFGKADDLPIKQDTDFFAAGGHSMFAVALLARIEARTGVHLPIRALLGAPTPQQLTRVVQQELAAPEAPFDPLVRYRLSNASRRLYIVHGAGGNVLRYRNLAGALHDVTEVIGIQAIGVEPGNTPDQTLAAMVDRYTEALLATNDEVFELGGYSDGGVIAIHLAHRLRQAGKTVRSLILLDAFVPGPSPRLWRDQLTNTRRSFANRETLSVGQWVLGSIVGWRKRADWDADGSEALKQMGYVDIYEVNEQAVQREPLPATLFVPALVVRTFEETPTRLRDYAIGYNPQQATIAWVHGAHDELIKPASIDELQAAIRGFLLAV
jgi:amino acid adenylation domain-containing protein